MNEIIVKLGGKHEYATDTKAAQTEALEPVQSYFKQFGACIIDGCAITPNGGNWDVAAGLVAIEHASGFKVARFAGVTNVALPGHLVIDETIVNGNYESGSDEVFRNYTAVWVNGAPGVSDDTVLKFGTPTTDIPHTFFRAAGIKANSAVETINANIFIGGLPGQPINFWINQLARTLHMQATIVVRDYSILTETQWPLFSVNLPLHMRPAAKQYFTAHVVASSSYPFVDSQNKDYVRAVPGYIDNTGACFLHIIKPNNGGTYTIHINAIMQLD